MDGRAGPRSCDFTAHMCTGMILSNYKFFVNPLFKLISIEHVIIGSKTQWKLCEDLIMRGSNDGSNGNDTEAAPSPLRVCVTV